MNRTIIESTTRNNVTGNTHVAYDNRVDSCIGPTKDEIWCDYSKRISNDR